MIWSLVRMTVLGFCGGAAVAGGFAYLLRQRLDFGTTLIGRVLLWLFDPVVVVAGDHITAGLTVSMLSNGGYFATVVVFLAVMLNTRALSIARGVAACVMILTARILWILIFEVVMFFVRGGVISHSG